MCASVIETMYNSLLLCQQLQKEKMLTLCRRWVWRIFSAVFWTYESIVKSSVEKWVSQCFHSNLDSRITANYQKDHHLFWPLNGILGLKITLKQSIYNHEIVTRYEVPNIEGNLDLVCILQISTVQKAQVARFLEMQLWHHNFHPPCCRGRCWFSEIYG